MEVIFLVYFILDAVQELFDRSLTESELLSACPHAAFYLADVERLFAAVFLYDNYRFFLNALIACETEAAGEALPSSPDC